MQFLFTCRAVQLNDRLLTGTIIRRFSSTRSVTKFNYFVSKGRLRKRADKILASALALVLFFQALPARAESSTQELRQRSNLDKVQSDWWTWMQGKGVTENLLNDLRLKVTQNDQLDDEKEIEKRFVAFGVDLMTHWDLFMNNPEGYLQRVNTHPEILDRTVNELLSLGSATLYFDSTMVPDSVAREIETIISENGGSVQGVTVIRHSPAVIIIVVLYVVTVVCAFVAVVTCVQVFRVVRHCKKWWKLLCFIAALIIFLICVPAIYLRCVPLILTKIFQIIVAAFAPPGVDLSLIEIGMPVLQVENANTQKVAASIAQFITLDVAPIPCALRVSWPSIEGAGHDITAIRLYRATENGMLALYRTFPMTASTFVDNAVLPSTRYKYAIALATSNGQEGDRSVTSSGIQGPCIKQVSLPTCVHGDGDFLTMDTVLEQSTGTLQNSRIEGYNLSSPVGRFSLKYSGVLNDSWNCVPSPPQNPTCGTDPLYAISLISSGEGFAIGSCGPDGYKLSAGSWQATPIPLQPGVEVGTLVMNRGTIPQTGWLGDCSGVRHYSDPSWNCSSSYCGFCACPSGPCSSFGFFFDRMSFPPSDSAHAWATLSGNNTFLELNGVVPWVSVTMPLSTSPGDVWIPIGVCLNSASDRWICGFRFNSSVAQVNGMYLAKANGSATPGVTPTVVSLPPSPPYDNPSNNPALMEVTFYPPDPTRGVVVGGSLSAFLGQTTPGFGLAYTTRNGGVTWSAIPITFPTFQNVILFRARFVDANTVYAIGVAGSPLSGSSSPILVKITL